MRCHNIVADRWAGAANPHPHPMPLPTPLPTQTHTQIASKTLVFPLLDLCSWMDQRTDRQTNGRTDKASYRVACPQLKIMIYDSSVELQPLFFTFISSFLVADTQLYKRLCPSVRWSVGRSVGRLVGWSVSWWFGQQRVCPPVSHFLKVWKDSCSHGSTKF